MDNQQLKVFGVIVAGRPIQTDFVQMSRTEFVIEVADSGSVNHVVVFLTGVAPFPADTGGTGMWSHLSRLYSVAENRNGNELALPRIHCK
uniref:Bm4011, isoform c n=1 Tax=Brugia malayi TaxID=6279 RepID=A0A1I9G528_BRUMA|nr:Bm4011, isoform c [Brugia malayi]